MPAFVGAVRLVNVSSGGQFQAGDVAVIVPKTESKTYGGSGNFNTGDFARAFNLLNGTNTIDMDVADENLRTGY
ncbi:spore germination protein [Effusibacillus pohliae]|uniref:spore germination protein n=1 Tax=Effusibacillus pohliae TaxID=232270 RepID=UPI000364DDA8|nr:spore germination protein [Effusibacillus pohliae]